MTNANLTEIVAIIDRSGSMGIVRDDTIGGINTFITDQKGVEGDANFTLVLFDDKYEVPVSSAPIGDVKLLTGATYVPRGSTALIDAVGKTINETGERLAALPEEERPGKVVIVILTDGHENASKEYTSAQVAEMVEKQRNEFNWEFVFMGANQDAWSSAANIGIHSNVANYVSTAQGTRKAFSAASVGMTNLRAADYTPDSYFVDTELEESKA